MPIDTTKTAPDEREQAEFTTKMLRMKAEQSLTVYEYELFLWAADEIDWLRKMVETK